MYVSQVPQPNLTDHEKDPSHPQPDYHEALQGRGTCIVLDHAIPGRKFIFSMRDPDAWYDSHIRPQKQVIGTDEIPTPEELKAHLYVRKGWLYDAKICQGRPEDKFY